MSCCRHPTRCCTNKYTEPTMPDECRCGRRANNGFPQVLLSQLFLFVGLWLSGATLGDCNLVTVADPILVRPDNVTTTSLGMLSYLDPDTNRCYYWWDDDVIVDGSTTVKDENGNEITGNYTSTVWTGNDQLTWYMQYVLGEDWYVPFGFCFVAYALSILLFVYGISFYCSTQVKPCRFFASCLAGICLPIWQGLGMMYVYNSEWCANEGCTMGRSTHFSFAAAASFFLAGIAFWRMDSWPGQSVLDELDENNKKERRDYIRERPQHKMRSVPGDTWIVKVEKSAAETSKDDIENGPSQKLDDDSYDETQAPSSHDSGTNRSKKDNDEPQPPMNPADHNGRAKRTGKRPKKRPKKRSGNRPKKYSKKITTDDPSGHVREGPSLHVRDESSKREVPSFHVRDGSSSSFAENEFSSHIEEMIPTVND